MSASCCGFARRNAAIFVLSLLLAVAVTGWIMETRRPQPSPPVEMVEVLVATKDLTTGTSFTKDSVEKLAEYKWIPKSELPPDAKLIRIKGELIGKRLSRATRQGESFNIADVNTRSIGWGGPNHDIMSISMNSGSVIPGTRVDVLATLVIGKRREVFTLLRDVYVLAINGEQDIDSRSQPPGKPVVSFAVTEEQARLVALALQRNCHLELLLRHPDAPTREFDYDKTLALLKQPDPEPEPPQPQLEVAPAPRVKM